MNQTGTEKDAQPAAEKGTEFLCSPLKEGTAVQLEQGGIELATDPHPNENDASILCTYQYVPGFDT